MLVKTVQLPAIPRNSFRLHSFYHRNRLHPETHWTPTSGRCIIAVQGGDDGESVRIARPSSRTRCWSTSTPLSSPRPGGCCHSWPSPSCTPAHSATGYWRRPNRSGLPSTPWRSRCRHIRQQGTTLLLSVAAFGNLGTVRPLSPGLLRTRIRLSKGVCQYGATQRFHAFTDWIQAP